MVQIQGALCSYSDALHDAHFCNLLQFSTLAEEDTVPSRFLYYYYYFYSLVRVIIV